MVDDLSERRGYRDLFRDLSFTVQPGSLLEITGPNGAGKSTLLHCLTGLRRPESGEIRWQGEPTNRSIKFQSDLRYVGHRVGVKASLTALENLELACAMSGTTRFNAISALERFSIKHCAGLPCRQLSAGQRRRVALARLVASPGRLWVLDEPFSALDRDGQALVSDAIRQFCGEGGTVVMTTHHAVAMDDIPVRQLTL